MAEWCSEQEARKITEDLVGSDTHRSLTLEAMAVGGSLERLRALEAAEQLSLLDFAQRNLVEPIVSFALLNAFGGEDFATAQRCDEVYKASEGRMDVLLEQLDLAAEALDAASIPVVGLKNAGIARGIYPHRGCCPMGDVDVLVKKSQFREAHRVIESCGFELASRSIVEEADLEAGLHGGGTEYVKNVRGVEVWFELQWRPVAGRWIREDQEPDGEELIDRSAPIEGSKLRLLEPTDNMLQVCLHTAKHSYVRSPGLRLHTDVDRLAHYTPPNWESFVGRAIEMRVSHSVFFSLALAKLLLSSEVPDFVLDALQPPAWKTKAMWRWFERADVFEPEDAKFNRPEMMAFHAMLYDDAIGLTASVLGTQPDELSWSAAPALLGSGASRMKDLVTRYQR